MINKFYKIDYIIINDETFNFYLNNLIVPRIQSSLQTLLVAVNEKRVELFSFRNSIEKFPGNMIAESVLRYLRFFYVDENIAENTEARRVERETSLCTYWQLLKQA